MQRTLAVVPFIKLDHFARDAAQDTTDWRIHMWQLVLPEVPKHLLLGKGLSMNAEEFAVVTGSGATGGSDPVGAMMAGDYHNGPLSMIIPFGLAGVFGFLWLIIAGLKALYSNYRYGDPELQRINTFLLASFVAKTIFFMAVFGAFVGDLAEFTGLLGLSVAINGGVRRPVPIPISPAVSAPVLASAQAHALS